MMTCDKAIERIQKKFSSKAEYDEFREEVMNMSEEEKQKFSENTYYSCIFNMLQDAWEE